MSVDIPNPMGVNLDVIGNVPVALEGIPSTFHLDVTNIPRINIGLEKVQVGLDKVQLGLDKIQVGVDRLDIALQKVQVGLDKINLAVDPLQISVALTEIPKIRAHLPANFKLSLRVLGIEAACIELCGEGQIITEPFVPNTAERRAEPPPRIVATPAPPAGAKRRGTPE